jgi:cation diffusion facilitator CzcD-associated flavoprotein CzcO
VSSSSPLVIIGAGPAGLALSACLGREDVPCTVIEKGEGVGTSWRNHYRRLHLHTAKQLSTLPGLGFGEDIPLYPSRAQVVEYLERYADYFDIRPRFGVEVNTLRRVGSEWVAESNEGTFRAERVVLATGLNRRPLRPRFPGDEELGDAIIHAHEYRTADPYRGKRVLVVGAGNTGAEIALDLCENDATVGMCIRGPLHVVPRDFMGRPTQVTGVLLRRLPRHLRDWISLRVSKYVYPDLDELGLRRPNIGIMSQIDEQRKIPLIDIGTIERIRRGEITVYPGIERMSEGAVHFSDGRRFEIDAVILATGYQSGIEDWVEGGESIIDEHGYPVPTSGRTALPGLYTFGFSNVSTGLLREIGIEAPKLAAELARESR